MDTLFESPLVLAIALLAVFAGVAAVVYVAGNAVRQSRTSGRGLRRTMTSYHVSGGAAVKTGSEHESTALGSSALARRAVGFTTGLVRRHNLEAELLRRLQAAAIPLRPGEWMLIHLGITFAAAIGFRLVSSSGGFMGVVVTLAGALVGFLLPYAYLDRKERKRREEFVGHLPDTLNLLASSLSAGHSFPQAVDAVVRDGQKTVKEEFGRALNQSRVGIPIEDTLDEVAVRMDCEDLEWAVMAVRINREVGGNLAEVLTSVATTLRERMYLRRQVRALSADGRMSAYVLIALPIFLGLFLMIRNPAYITPLFTTRPGLIMSITMVVLMVVGWLWMKKIVKVEV